ncbi:UDP-glucose dehydrogenase family protein [Streptosporangium amethystogenes]|uniref:UDP-glucose dehydrogenase family protein n=1 Tax=Streptosporangium amethystogenes TaxID=2002 RepID=UPI0004CA3466|nr:UDP-glucose/GDP-mannose dehydrogenase family protein [Streptosporangium amethystogenes]
MKINIIGCGRLGLPYAVGMARMGHQILGLDADPKTMRILSAGRTPFDEPGLAEAIASHGSPGKLRFTDSYDDATAFADLHILCVGTPQQIGALAADLGDLERAVIDLASRLRRDAVIVVKSSVPVGTTRHLAELARSMAPAHVRVTVACSPDFLRESTSLADVARPSRIVLGIASGDEHAEQLLRRVRKAQLDAGALMVVTDLTTAEMCKTAANAFLATKISFINAVASLCEATGTDVSSLAHTLALDPRIGDAYLDAGVGYGGSCLPKDVRSLIAQGRTHGVGADLELLVQVDRVNQRRQLHTVDLARHACGGDLTNRRVGIWGLSFKPDVDDLRDSPALAVALAIHHEGGIVTAYDPAAMDFARDLHPELRYALAAGGAVEGAEVLLHLTAWPEFIEADPAKLVRSAAVPIVVDGRAALDPDLWSDAGWSYRALGRE